MNYKINKSEQNETHISDENNYNYNVSGNTQFPTQNSNTSYNNNYNYDNNYNNTTNNNSNNNNFNNNSSAPTPDKYNFETKTSDNLDTNYSNVPTNDNKKFEENKFCRCCYNKDLLIELDCMQKFKIIIMSIFHLLFTIGDVFYTLKDIFIIHIMNFIQFIYGIFFFFFLKKNKCIRYFTTVFSIINLFAGNLVIIAEAIFLWKIGKGKPDDNKDPDGSFVTIMIAVMRACCLLALTKVMLFIFCHTCCEEHNCREGDDNHIRLVYSH